MLDYAACAEEIAAVIRGVGGSGVVHNRVRSAPKWKDFIARFVVEQGGVKVVCGWQVSRRAGRADGEKWLDTWSLVHVCGAHDETEAELPFQQNLNDVARALRGPGVLTFGVAPEMMSIDLVEDRMFGDVLCHVAECTLVTGTYAHLI